MTATVVPYIWPVFCLFLFSNSYLQTIWMNNREERRFGSNKRNSQVKTDFKFTVPTNNIRYPFEIMCFTIRYEKFWTPKPLRLAWNPGALSLASIGTRWNSNSFSTIRSAIKSDYVSKWGIRYRDFVEVHSLVLLIGFFQFPPYAFPLIAQATNQKSVLVSSPQMFENFHECVRYYHLKMKNG